jgi:hypothetical protein
MLITQTPNTFSPAYNELVYVVHSDNQSAPNYKYICDIYTADGTTRLARVKRIPQPDGYGVFDIHRIIENYLSHDLDPGTSGFTANTKSYAGYIVKFGEEYGAAVSGPVQYLSLVSDSKRYAFNGIFDFPEFMSYNEADWLMAAGSQKQFLTRSPRVQNTRPGTNAWLYFMTDTSVVNKLVLRTYDASGTLLNSYIMFNALTDMSHDENRFLRIPAGPANAGSAFSATLDSSIHHYTLHLEDSDDNSISETFTFNINTDPTKYSWYRLHFLNKLGGFDSFDFRQLSRSNLDISRNYYKRFNGFESAGAWSHALDERGDTQYDTEIREKIIINSDWITDAEAAWLEELHTSPAVFLERADKSLLAINIETNNYEIKQKANDKLLSVQLAFGYAFDKGRQRY